MRVLFDHQIFSWQSYGGISRYFFEIAKGLSELGHTTVFPEGFFSENVYLRALPNVHTRSLTPFPFKGKKWLQERLGRNASLRALRMDNADIFHPTYFDAYFLKTILQHKTPFVITIHDMIHEKYGHGGQGLFSLDAKVVENKRLLAQKAQAIIVVSENTKQDVLTYMPEIDAAKIHTIYHGNSLQAPAEGHTNSLSLPRRYLLFVGQRRGYKNFSWMLEQLAELLRSDPTLYLVCAGGSNFSVDETAQIANAGLTNVVLHIAGPSDAELSELYCRAQCFIFPSQYEGFGIPVLEAFACGCPAILNAVSSLPEVGGDAVLYFNENDENGLTNSVNLLLNDQALSRSLVEKGHVRAQQFTWQNSVTAHLNVYKKMIESV